MSLEFVFVFVFVFVSDDHAGRAAEHVPGIAVAVNDQTGVVCGDQRLFREPSNKWKPVSDRIAAIKRNGSPHKEVCSRQLRLRSPKGAADPQVTN